MDVFLDLDWCRGRCRCSSDGHNRCWLRDLDNWRWSNRCSRSRSPVGVDGLDKDILHSNNISLDNSLDQCRLITPMVYMGKGIA